MRRHFGLIIVAALALMAAGCVGALFPTSTSKVSGVVLLNGEPLDGVPVTVIAANTDFSAEAAADGSFQMELPSPGRYKLEVRSGVPLEGKGEALAPSGVDIVVQRGRPMADVVIDSFYLPALPITMDFSRVGHQRMVEKPYPGLEIDFIADPDGKTVLFFEQGNAGQKPPGTYDAMRWATFAYPDLDNFTLEVHQRGEGTNARLPADYPDYYGNNRSLALVFGFQDLQNMWIAYLTYTDTTRLIQIRDGKQVEDIEECKRGVARLAWVPNNDEYQSAAITLEDDVRDGQAVKVLRTYVNGEPALAISECVIPAARYTPGKVGVGGHSDSSAQSWYIDNVFLDIEPYDVVEPH